MVSIIVPIWNAEFFLEKTIESVIMQTYKKWELLLIDDGSTDHSLEICYRFSNNDNRIRVFSKANEGVSRTRNFGIKYARGEWLYFLDSDDWIETDCLEKAVKKAENTNADILCWNFYYNFKDRERKARDIYPWEQTLNEPEELICTIMFPRYDEKERGRYLGTIQNLWSKLIKAELIVKNQIMFEDSMIIGEDSFFCAKCFKVANSFVFVNEYWYHYRENEFSANRRYREDAMDIYKKSMEAFANLMCPYIADIEYATCYMGLIWSYVNRVLDKKTVNIENREPLAVKLVELKTFLNESEIQKVFCLKVDKSIFRKDQKIMLCFIKYKCVYLLYLFQKCKVLFRKLRDKFFD